MSQWIDRIQGHPVFQELIDLEQTLESSREAAQSDTTSFDAWERIERVVKFIRSYLTGIDPVLVPPGQLNNSQGQLQAARAQLSSFASSRNVNHLNEANNHIDNVLTYLANIPLQDRGTAAHELGEAAAAYRKSVGSLVRAFEKQFASLATEKDALQTRIQELTTEVAAQKQRADNVITQMQQQFAVAQESRQTEAANQEGKRVSEFETAEERRAQEHDSAQSIRQQLIDQFLTEIKGTHDSLRVELTGSGKALIDSLEEQKAYAEKVVGIISTEAVAHGYGRTANEERNAAKGWRWVAVGALVVWIVAGVFFFGLTYERDLSFSALARQFLISTPFVLLAGFAALQVSKHQRAERFNRQQELEIAAIDPYLATFDDETRNEVKRALAEKLFGQRETETLKGESKQIFDTVADTLKTVKQLQESLKK